MENRLLPHVDDVREAVAFAESPLSVTDGVHYGLGYCLICGEENCGIPRDAENYICTSCDRPTVLSANLAMQRNLYRL